MTVKNLLVGKSNQTKSSRQEKIERELNIDYWYPPTDYDKAYRNKQRLIGLSGDWEKQIILITHDQISFGRISQMQIKFSDRSVSRQHASLLRTSKGVYIRDEGSSLGTYVNGLKINSVQKLINKDIIQIGKNNYFEFRDRK